MRDDKHHLLTHVMLAQINVVTNRKCYNILHQPKLASAVMHAAKKAEEHLNKSIEASWKIGANSPLALALMDLGTLHVKRENEA